MSRIEGVAVREDVLSLEAGEHREVVCVGSCQECRSPVLVIKAASGDQKGPLGLREAPCHFFPGFTRCWLSRKRKGQVWLCCCPFFKHVPWQNDHHRTRGRGGGYQPGSATTSASRSASWTV